MILDELFERVKVVLQSDLSASAKIAFVGLSVHSADGRTSIGQRKLSDLCGMSRNTLQAALQALADGGFVKIDGNSLDRREYRLAADVGPKKRSGKRPADVPFEPFDLIGIVKCAKCAEWVDVERCEKLNAGASDDRLIAELVN